MTKTNDLDLIKGLDLSDDEDRAVLKTRLGIPLGDTSDPRMAEWDRLVRENYHGPGQPLDR